MKVVVYAICKNEAQFVDRWMDSMGEADQVVVLDTGSTDGTAERLRALGAVVVEERVEPWRFDTARNRSLELVPEDADICVCTDLDEVFHPGWRSSSGASATDSSSRGRYCPRDLAGSAWWSNCTPSAVHFRPGPQPSCRSNTS